MDWWIQGVPDHLPSPAIRPEPITFERHGMVGDLISLGDDCDENDKGNGNEESNLYDSLYFSYKFVEEIYLHTVV